MARKLVLSFGVVLGAFAESIHGQDGLQTSTCLSGNRGDAPEDDTSLMQSAIAVSRRASLNGENDAPLGEDGYPPQDEGFYKWDGTSSTKTCFLSKKSLFTCPYEWCQHTMTAGPGPPGCRDVEGLAEVDKVNTDAADCATCLAGMRANLQKETWLVKGEKPADCVRCGAEWTQICLKGDKKVLKKAVKGGLGSAAFGMAQDLNWFGDYIPDKAGMSAEEVKKQQDVFKAQEDFMLLLSEKLVKRKVSLYLDFQDEEAKDLVDDYEGRDKAFKNNKFYSEMLKILSTRAKTSNNFLKWTGASGDFCLAEQSGRPSDDTKTFAFPPLATLQGDVEGHSYEKALCLGGQASFFVDLCTKCGGTDCNAGCHGGTLV